MKKIFLFFSSVFLLTSCEWNGSDDDNYVEIEKPPATINLSVDLAGINPEEVIQIANESYLTYTLYSGGHDLIEQKFYLDGVEKPYSTSGMSGYSVYLEGYPVDGTVHELKVVMALKTNSGSLAEISQAEYYTGEYNFKLKFFNKNQSPDLNVRQSLSENKYLELQWDKPKTMTVEKYEVYARTEMNSVLIATINNPNETRFVDKAYHYGWKEYTVKAVPANSIGIPDMSQDHTAEYTIFNQDRIATQLTPEMLKINWTAANPYPVKYVVAISGNSYPVEAGKTSLEIPRPYFPYMSTYTTSRIYLLPPDANVSKYEKYPYSDFYFSDKQTYQYPYWTQFLDSKSNTVVALRDRNFYKYDVRNNLTLVKSGTLPNNISYPDPFVSDSYSYASNGMVAIRGSRLGTEAIYLFQNCDFTEVIKTFNVLPDRFCISDTHLFYIANKTLCALNIGTGQIDDQKAFDSLYDTASKLVISPDGKYLVNYSSVVDHSWYTIYEFKNDKLQEIKHGDVQVRLICFNPDNGSQLFFHDYDNRFLVMDVATQNVSKTVEKNRYLYSDPYTGNVLCYENETGSFNVLDKSLSNSLYKVKASIYFPSPNDFMLVNNILYSNQEGTGHYYMDISESIK